MCGIFALLSVSKDEEQLLNEFKLFEECITRRGPNSINIELCNIKTCNILFAASVLWLQGREIVIQPIIRNDAVFLYNGDIFGGSLVDDTLRNEIGDTILFFDLLKKSSNIIQTVSGIEGPYAFVYFDKLHNQLYFGRDIYGRRSLLIGKHENDIIITSVAKRNSNYSFLELPCTGIFSINVITNSWQILPWGRRNKNFKEKMLELESFLKQNIFIQQVNLEEVQSFIPPNEFQLTVLDSIFNLPNEMILQHMSNSILLDKIVILENLLENSIKKRILSQPKFCQNCFKNYACKHATIGVLFSGGIDCAILALLLDKFIDNEHPIDLMNVAFESKGTFDTPDRLTGRSTLAELQHLCPKRKWNFVEINVKTAELNLYRTKIITNLIYPLNTILDDSLGCALWFASRAVSTDYTSPCRSLLVGMGADELFGGYTRHRAAFQKRNWEGLHESLEEDWQNLPHRNLGRDDRVISDHGRQLRTPYLDEDVVNFIQNLNCWDKTLPSKDLPQGIGEKILLRCLAYHLGLKKAATFKKRALQFGSRIANSKEKGHEISQRLQNDN